MVNATSGHDIFLRRQQNLQHTALSLYDKHNHSRSTQLGYTVNLSIKWQS